MIIVETLKKQRKLQKYRKKKEIYYFHKFSEIQLHPEEKLKLEQEYYTKQLLTQNQPNETL